MREHRAYEHAEMCVSACVYARFEGVSWCKIAHAHAGGIAIVHPRHACVRAQFARALLRGPCTNAHAFAGASMRACVHPNMHALAFADACTHARACGSALTNALLCARKRALHGGSACKRAPHGSGGREGGIRMRVWVLACIRTRG